MNGIVASFAKLTACTAVLFGAPLLVASATNVYVVEVEKYLEYRACLVTAQLDNVNTECKR
jgi:Sec-independent protein secretion pathway component TatC